MAFFPWNILQQLPSALLTSSFDQFKAGILAKSHAQKWLNRDIIGRQEDKGNDVW